MLQIGGKETKIDSTSLSWDIKQYVGEKYTKVKAHYGFR